MISLGIYNRNRLTEHRKQTIDTKRERCGRGIKEFGVNYTTIQKN